MIRKRDHILCPRLRAFGIQIPTVFLFCIFQDMSAVAVVTANEGLRGSKIIPLRKTVKATLSNNQCPTVKNVFVMERTSNLDVIESTDIRLSQVLPQMSTECEPAAMDSEDLLFVLYTSGSTGAPKGIAHSTAGYLLYTAFTHKHVFNYYNQVK